MFSQEKRASIAQQFFKNLGFVSAMSPFSLSQYLNMNGIDIIEDLKLLDGETYPLSQGYFM